MYIYLFGGILLYCSDQTYWQSAIAADPTAAHKGYMLGSLCWFAIPFSFATAMGLANVALQLPTSFEVHVVLLMLCRLLLSTLTVTDMTKMEIILFLTCDHMKMKLVER